MKTDAAHAVAIRQAHQQYLEVEADARHALKTARSALEAAAEAARASGLVVSLPEPSSYLWAKHDYDPNVYFNHEPAITRVL